MQIKESKTNSHFWLSMIKSVIRIGGCFALMYGEYTSAGMSLFVAEIVGIIEEL